MFPPPPTPSPAAPLTPYDTFSGAPMVPGNMGESALYVTPTFHGSGFDVAATFGLGYITGSTTTATYWGESLFPTLNPHLGSQQLGYAVAFPTHASQDDGSAFAASLLSGSIATSDGAFKTSVLCAGDSAVRCAVERVVGGVVAAGPVAEVQLSVDR